MCDSNHVLEKDKSDVLFEVPDNSHLANYLQLAGRDKQSVRVENCSRHARLYVCNSGCNKLWYTPMACGFRFCPRCSINYAARLREEYIEPVIAFHRLSNQRTYRFMFLTLTHSGENDIHTVNSLLRNASRLIRVLWPSKYEGALTMIDIGSSGNIHIHAIVYGRFVPQSLVSQLWNQMHGASIVDIRSIPKPEHAASYLSKYVAKDLQGCANAKDEGSDSEPNHRFIDGFVWLLKGSKRVKTWRAIGIFYTLHTKELKLEFECPECGGFLKYLDMINTEDAVLYVSRYKPSSMCSNDFW